MIARFIGGNMHGCAVPAADLLKHTVVIMGVHYMRQPGATHFVIFGMTPENAAPLIAVANGGLTDEQFEAATVQAIAAGFPDLAPCCKNEQRSMDGWCKSCGDPCY